VEELV